MGLLRPSLFLPTYRCPALVSRLLLLFLLFGCASVFSPFAQTPSGSIVGKVSEKHGGPLAGARVTVTNTQSGATSSVATDVNGQFTVENLPAGAYHVKIAANGFVSQEEQVKVKPWHKSKLSATLKPSAK